jgi:protein gp37
VGEVTRIAWTDRTFNPWVGCVKVSEGCRHCYAEVLMVQRFKRRGIWGPAAVAGRQRTRVQTWRKPVLWNQEAAERGHQLLVFCGSLCDVFEDHPDANAVRPDLWDLIRVTPHLTWQLLTKRPENIPFMLPADWGEGWANVWLGTSIEDGRVAERAIALRRVPAAVRFISYEPALGPLDHLTLDGIDWVIYGGESGPGYREHDLNWPRRMRDVCQAQGVAFFYKQSSAPKSEMGIELDGEIVRQWPWPRLSAASPYRWELVAGAPAVRDLPEPTTGTPNVNPPANRGSGDGR